MKLQNALPHQCHGDLWLLGMDNLKALIETERKHWVIERPARHAELRQDNLDGGLPIVARIIDLEDVGNRQLNVLHCFGKQGRAKVQRG